MNHKKFMDIERLKPTFADGFQKGDYIVIQEKIDGANAAIRYDFKTDNIVAQSRKNILDIKNNLRGFYEWTQTLDKELIKTVLGDNLVLFCLLHFLDQKHQLEHYIYQQIKLYYCYYLHL